MKQLQTVSAQDMKKSLEALGNAANQEVYSKLLKSYTVQKDLHAKNELAINKIEYAAQNNDYDTVIKELGNYHDNHQEVFNGMRPPVDLSPMQQTEVKVNSYKPVENTYKEEPVHNIPQTTYQGFKPLTTIKPDLNNISNTEQTAQSKVKETHQKAEEYKYLCDLVDIIVRGKDVTVPDGWEIIDKQWNKETNFKGAAFKKDDTILVCFAGTDKFSGKDLAANVKMGFDKTTQQMEDANKFFQRIYNNSKYSDCKFRIAGHSEGGSEGTYTGLYNIPCITYNTFPLGMPL